MISTSQIYEVDFTDPHRSSDPVENTNEGVCDKTLKDDVWL